MSVIELSNVKKVYDVGFNREVVALDDVSYKVNQGEIFGLVGPNGSGKTTTLKLLLGLIFPSSGEVSLFGKEPQDISSKRRIGFMPDGPYFYDYLTAEEFLHFYGRLFGYSKEEREGRIDNLLKLVDMENARKLPFGRYSRGMMQRMSLAQALINDPDLLMADEPISGLDPLGVREMKDLMIRLREEGKTVFICSHMLGDVQEICDRVVILHEGNLVREGTIEDLTGESRFTEIVASKLDEQCIGQITALGAEQFLRDDETVFQVRDKGNVVPAIDIIRSSGADLISVLERQDTLEEIFVKAVGGRDSE